MCQRLGITFMAYSPLGRGFLTGSIRSSADLETKDFRRTHPRFQEDNLRANLGLVDHLRSLAEARSDTAAQLALAWVLQQPWDIVPIVATRSSKHFKGLEEHPGLGFGCVDDNAPLWSNHVCLLVPSAVEPEAE